MQGSVYAADVEEIHTSGPLYDSDDNRCLYLIAGYGKEYNFTINGDVTIYTKDDPNPQFSYAPNSNIKVGATVNAEINIADGKTLTLVNEGYVGNDNVSIFTGGIDLSYDSNLKITGNNASLVINDKITCENEDPSGAAIKFNGYTSDSKDNHSTNLTIGKVDEYLEKIEINANCNGIILMGNDRKNTYNAAFYAKNIIINANDGEGVGANAQNGFEDCGLNVTMGGEQTESIRIIASDSAVNIHNSNGTHKFDGKNLLFKGENGGGVIFQNDSNQAKDTVNTVFLGSQNTEKITIEGKTSGLVINGNTNATIKGNDIEIKSSDASAFLISAYNDKHYKNDVKVGDENTNKLLIKSENASGLTAFYGSADFQADFIEIKGSFDYVDTSDPNEFRDARYGIKADTGLDYDNVELTFDSDYIKISGHTGIYANSGEDVTGSVTLNVKDGLIEINSKDKSVWASGDGGQVNINGAVKINGKYNDETTTFTVDEENAGIAIVAGKQTTAGNDRYGEVNVNLQGTQNSYITGDIVGARDGVVNINSDNYNGSLTIQGDILAGNGGTRTDDEGNNVTVGAVNLDLGKNGYLEGRVDDYQDADLKDSSNLEFFDPHFTDGKVSNSGTVNIDLGEGSKWNVTGQSWVTKLEGNGTVILVGSGSENGTITEGTGGYAVHIGELKGDNTFVLNLTPDALETSDMIYVQNSTEGTQTILLNNERDLLDNTDWDEIRFATVANALGSAENVNTDYGGSFGDTYTIKGRGVRNVDYEIKYVAMDEDTTSGEDNKKYNGGKDFDEVKPGEDYVQDNYNKIDEGQNSQYIYLVRNENDTPVVNPDEDLTDSGKTVINMSRANYKNAIYMDRLNKRLGEARYINNEEEQGMWVRLRHDRIGQSGDFRSMNTMYELGYDEKQDCDNGERRVGFAVDYMRGNTTYSDILGKGETKRYGLWLYDTWMGDKGHYADYVAKWGHLSNDFDIRDKDSFERVTGDYSNNVFSVSAEYGRKKDIGNDWYIEPQAQLQLARVTGAEYTTTTQDTKVSVDGINSLIGRAGFRLGRDVDERSTVYIKADLLHEFLGNQTITATDATGSLRETFENKGTWYDVGFGFATALGKDSYAFMDFEKSFGNDNDETYQINAGVQWTF